MFQLIIMAFRNIGRNRRRSFFSSLALGMGLALLILMAAFINGEMSNALNSTIRLQSGHLQIRASTYDEAKTSLKWEDLVQNPESIIQKISILEPIKVATPRLFATGIVAVRDETAGVRIIGIDPLSEANDPYKQGLLEGTFLSPDDREGLLLGQPLAKRLGLKVGDKLMLSVNTSNGDVVEQGFIIRGIYSTETYAFDSLSVFLPLAKAQAIAQADNHASTIFILLKDKAQTQAVAEALKGTDYQVLTWNGMNEVIIQTEQMANAYMVVLYLIVLVITSTVITNTLVMAVFERTREIGILASIGMKSWKILVLFLTESGMLAVGGIIMGLALGLASTTFFSSHGFYIGNMGITGMMIGNTIYTELTMDDTIRLSIIAFVVTLLAGIYPAIIAARLEPVDALRGNK